MHLRAPSRSPTQAAGPQGSSAGLRDVVRQQQGRAGFGELADGSSGQAARIGMDGDQDLDPKFIIFPSVVSCTDQVGQCGQRTAGGRCRLDAAQVCHRCVEVALGLLIRPAASPG